jgi:thiol-disulfide isomerase/thioredoxin
MANRSHTASTLILITLVMAACGTLAAPAGGVRQPATLAVPTPGRPEWFSVRMTDVRTGAAFSINDFSGKVVLVETMATWCPTCIYQAAYVRNLHKLLGNREDLVSISLDEDLNEDAPLLKAYVEEYGFEWRFAVAPLVVNRALGNLYSAEFHNPPLSPMLLIDRAGDPHQLEFGLKNAERLQAIVEPYLNE